MNSIYKGKEPCHGCGRSGEEAPRLSKNGLCHDCTEALNIGRSLIKERNLERRMYVLDDIMKSHLQWYSIPVSEVHAALKNLLKTFSMFDERNASNRSEIVQDDYLAGRADSGTSSDTIVIPVVTFDAAKRLTTVLEDICWKLEKERRDFKEEIAEQCRKELHEEKNRIYNEGVRHGRNLLMQLNSGEITLSDFERPVEYLDS